MGFLGKFIWYGGIGFEAAILLRSLWTRNYQRFPIFYTYMACVLANSVTLLAINPNSIAYRNAYWYWNAVTVLLGYGVLVEIMHRTLIEYPGADRVARAMALIVFATCIGGLLVSSALHHNPITIPDWTMHVNALERDLRIVQAVFLTITLAVALHYRIELGRALGGLTLGFGSFVAVSIISTALGYQIGPRFQPIAEELQPIGYLFALSVWLIAFWGTVKVQSKPPNPKLEDDYRKILAMTREKLREVRSRFIPLESR